MVEIKINDAAARINEGFWSSGDEILRRLIEAQMPFFERESDDYAPDQDLAKAKYIAKLFGGGITLYEPVESDAPDNTVF